MKRKTMLCLSLAVAAFAAVVTSSRINVLSQSKVKAPSNNDEISESVIRRGFEIAPVPRSTFAARTALLSVWAATMSTLREGATTATRTHLTRLAEIPSQVSRNRSTFLVTSPEAQRLVRSQVAI